MAPIKRKCCVPLCPNTQPESKKQFFKIGANLEERNKWRPDKGVAPKSQLLYCCEDHFDLPNDALNYIRYKYCPGTKLKLRPDTLPHKKLPINVCRLCLDPIYNGDDIVDISQKKGGECHRIVATLMPEIDLSLTVEPVVCLKCFEPLESFFKIKQKVLNSEIVIVNCIKSIVKKSPRRLLKSCEIDLFEEYNAIKELQETEKSKRNLTNKNNSQAPNEDKMDLNDEEIVIQIEEPIEEKYMPSETETVDYKVEASVTEDNSVGNDIQSLIEHANTDGHYEIIQETNTEETDIMHYE